MSIGDERDAEELGAYEEFNAGNDNNSALLIIHMCTIKDINKRKIKKAENVIRRRSSAAIVVVGHPTDIFMESFGYFLPLLKSRQQP